jgi:hypothetical protein
MNELLAGVWQATAYVDNCGAEHVQARPDLDPAPVPNGTSPPILTIHAVSVTLGATMGLTYLAIFPTEAREMTHGHACLQPTRAAQTFGRFVPDALANPSLRGLP